MDLLPTPTTDRLPEPGVRVLGFMVYIDYKGRRETLGWYSVEYRPVPVDPPWILIDGVENGYFDLEQCTHWQPVPPDPTVQP